MSRAWSRLALTTGIVAAAALGAAALLLEREVPSAPAPKVAVRSTEAPPAAAPAEPEYGGAGGAAAPSSGTPTLAPQVALAPQDGPPRRVNDVTLARDPADLAGWVADSTLDATLRYAALRRLESLSPADAVGAAITALDDTTPLVRLNAIAVLSRHDDPRAKEALSRIDPKSQRLAQALVARR